MKTFEKRKLYSYNVMFFLVGFIVLTCFITSDLFAGNAKLTESKASTIIDQHINEYYSPVYIGRKEFVLEKKKYDNYISFCNKLKKAGFIEYSTDVDITGGVRHIETKLTEKGLNNHIVSDDINKYVGFLAGHRKIIKIIKIEPDDELVYFAYLYTPNELGNLFGEKAKYRGKAKIVYDLFLDKFIFKGAMISGWEKEEWRNTTWVYNKGGIKILNYGMKEK